MTTFCFIYIEQLSWIFRSKLHEARIAALRRVKGCIGVHFGRTQTLLVTTPAYIPTYTYTYTYLPYSTRASRLVTRPFTFIICRFTAGSHYRMQIRGAPKAEGQSRGKGKGALVKTSRIRTGLPRIATTTRQVRVRAFDTYFLYPARIQSPR